MTVLNAPGLIDAGYRDELKVLLVNTDATARTRSIGATASPSSSSSGWRRARWPRWSTLDGVNRGGGFGHTGR